MAAIRNNNVIKLIALLCIVFVILSCNNGKQRYCSEVEKKVLNEQDCVDLVVNIQSKYLFGDLVRYYVWEKYKVDITRKMEITSEDSCYFAAVVKLIDDENINIDNIFADVDSLVHFYGDSSIQYFDGVYSDMLEMNNKDNKIAKPINGIENYNKFIDSLGNKLKSYVNNKSDFFIKLWISINENGSINNLEIVNTNCADSIFNYINSEFRKLKWNPAIVNSTPVKYRYQENIYIH